VRYEQFLVGGHGIQTFLPYQSFQKTAKVLDNKRLSKQRVETLQILNALAGLPSRWLNHPATQMWKGYERLLIYYGLAICTELISRGFKDICTARIMVHFNSKGWPLIDVPKWLGHEPFHASHRSSLLRKHPEHYRQFGWSEPDNLPYFWPTKKGMA
jgi:hypothetical protein